MGGDPLRLRALHLFANWKWTGPADPAIRTAVGLRRLGLDLMFAQARRVDPGQEHVMARRLRERHLPVSFDMELPKHYGPLVAWRDAGVLAGRLRRGDFDLLHSHLLSDHITAALARRRSGSRPLLVRSMYEPGWTETGLRARWALRQTDGVVVPTRRAQEQLIDGLGWPEERILRLEPSIDAARIRAVQGDLRQDWGLEAGHQLIGITARVQPHRRFRFLWRVLRKVVDAQPQVRLVLLGRGNDKDLRELVHEPIAALGLRDHVLLPGYLEDPAYSKALHSLDLFYFLVPGSDGTCRAVREAMAAGVPVVCSKRGILPELVGRRHEGDGREACGLTLDEDEELFAASTVKLLRNAEALQRLRAACLDRVDGPMDAASAARRLLAFYGRLGALR